MPRRPAATGWRALAYALGIAALLSPLLAIHMASPTQWSRVALNATHAPIFAGVAWLLASFLKRCRPLTAGEVESPVRRYLLVLVLAIALGVLIELVQGTMGRPPSLFDVLTDTAGALVGLAAWTLLGARQPAGGSRDSGRRSAAAWHRTVVALGLLGLVFALWHPVEAAVAYARRALMMPTIARYSSPIDLTFTTTDGAGARLDDLPAPWSRAPAERALAIRYDPAHPPAVQILEPSADWRGYDVIAADVTNAGSTDLAMVLRILDATHDWSHEDRLNLPVLIPARTRATIRVTLDAVERAPASRRMDLGRIANVMLFGRPPGGAGTLYVSRLWLE